MLSARLPNCAGEVVSVPFGTGLASMVYRWVFGEWRADYLVGAKSVGGVVSLKLEYAGWVTADEVRAAAE